jgi:hypothetical protein
VFGKRSGFAAAVGLCVVGLWLLRSVVIPASSRRRREPVRSVASLAAASSDLH